MVTDRTFRKPIETIVGLGFIRQIRTIEEAYTFLIDWRGLPECSCVHAIALKAVKAALNGEIETETARSLVEAFAKRAGLLAPSMDGPIADASLAGKAGQEAH